MCEPATITAITAFAAAHAGAIAAGSLALSAASTGLAYMGQKQAAEDNQKAANITAANTFNDLGARNSQIDQQQSESTLSNLIDAHAAQGQISASASAFGTGAATTAQLSNAADFAAGRDASISDLNSTNARLQSSSLATGAVLKRQSQINSVQGPSPVSLALGLTKDALGSVGTYRDLGGKLA